MMMTMTIAMKLFLHPTTNHETSWLSFDMEVERGGSFIQLPLPLSTLLGVSIQKNILPSDSLPEILASAGECQGV